MLTKAQIKYIQSLHQKKFRAETGAYIAEGPKIATEVLTEIPRQVQYVAASPAWLTAHACLLKDIPGERVAEVSPPELERLSALVTPNEVLVVLSRQDTAPWVLPEGAWCLALDDVRDPGNLGTIIRIADWFGVGFVVCSEACAEWYNPKVIQATMGSFLRVRALYTDLTAWLKKAARPVYAATLEGEPVTRLGELPPGVVLVGNESRGIDPGLRALATREVTIPRAGSAESLNAAIATGIILSHLVQD
ncbi:RNA methyltransferase [Dinghuibacter silviterrae]|uniref:TrmH family RNA methyltransferase n=1 Tax=Dinghuibacter silviterrae TaxID=1539049 RepID=A0A4R8DRT4_9BACT|nr:RNA methyltransferase [Dinghuibacter silviterrae]TDX00934.1 TrmH family RNA methyltransferase [Dinghuibacter silviterrae]